MTASISASSRLVLAKAGISTAGETLYLADAGVIAERLAGSAASCWALSVCRPRAQWTNYLFAGSDMIGIRVEHSDATTYTRYPRLREDKLPQGPSRLDLHHHR